ncbi:MAG TPA: hypothetical protein VKQ07_07050 [Jatrophihabitantaceae bacterium]|nr:hypothetical protein [Jatrophihabitantaceae bacterium]
MPKQVAAAAAALLAAAAFVSFQTASPQAAQAAVTHSSTGMYQALAPARILNTTLGAHATVGLHVLGTGGIPTSNVSAVAIAFQAYNSAAAGYITAWPSGTRPGVSNLTFAAGQHITNLAVVPVSTSGGIELYNGSSGGVQLLGDVAGYFSGGAPVNPGGFAPLGPQRILAGTTVGAHATLSLAVAGAGGVPASGASAVVINVMAYRPAASGYVVAYPDGQSRPQASSVTFVAGQSIANLVVAPLGADGKIQLYNGSNGVVQMYADVAGYFIDGAPIDGGALGALSPQRILNTTTGLGQGGHAAAVPARGIITLQVTGTGGVPTSAVAAAVVNLLAYQPGASGYITVWPGGTRPGVSSLTFQAGQQMSNLMLARLSSTGSVSLYNGSNATVQLFADVFGYVLSGDTSVPNGTVSHYVNSLAALSATSGCNDAKTGPGLVLLQIGAQTITAPRSMTDPGVALVFSDPVSRPSYAQLVTAINTYIGGFTGAGCQVGGVTTTIAIGTNNDGAFSPATYTPQQRGADWANDVVDAVASHAGITIAGANDIEAGFASSESQAETWVTNFLSNTTAKLVYNGAAENCPTIFNSAGDCGPVLDDNGVTKTWTRANYVALTYGLGPGRIQVLPQVYYDGQAMQWTNIDITSDKRLSFAGSLTQAGDTNCQPGCGYSPEQGWASLRNALAAIGAMPGNVATDLRIG